jgi:large subunit ribosomal protein L6
MSRIGKLPIVIPKNVEIQSQNSELRVQGPFGKLNLLIPKTIQIIQTEARLTVELSEKTKNLRSLHGLYRTLIQNMVIGVSEQFTLNLILKGVGYRATVQNKELILNLGYSHPVKLHIPEEISVEVAQNTTIILKSCNKEQLGLFASKVRSWRPPEPYKGKGILYENEQILRKAGKSAK